MKTHQGKRSRRTAATSFGHDGHYRFELPIPREIPDLPTSWQFLERGKRYTPEQRLLFELLLAAPRDYRCPRTRTQTLEWVIRNDPRPFGFNYVCDHLGLNAGRMRVRLLKSFARIDPRLAGETLRMRIKDSSVGVVVYDHRETMLTAYLPPEDSGNRG